MIASGERTRRRKESLGKGAALQTSVTLPEREEHG